MKIILKPTGPIQRGLLEDLKTKLNVIFGLATEVGPVVQDLETAFDKRRGQYVSWVLLKLIEPEAGRDKTLGITDVDLYARDLNYVFGQADPTAQVAVISLARLKPEFEGGQPDDLLLRERVLKEAVHELGHTFGLKHCEDQHCVMHFSNSLVDTDRKGAIFCPKCRPQLRLM
jgi:archaemetzincin